MAATRIVAAASLAAAVAGEALAQADNESRCRSEVANRGFGGYTFDQAQSRPNLVTGLMRSQRETLEFQCDIDSMGNITEVRVDRPRATRPTFEGGSGVAEYRRGYTDGLRRMPWNNYRNSTDYGRGYDDGYRDSRQRR